MRYLVFDAAYCCREYLGYVDAESEDEAFDIVEEAMERGEHAHLDARGECRLEEWTDPPRTSAGKPQYVAPRDFNWVGCLNDVANGVPIDTVRDELP